MTVLFLPSWFKTAEYPNNGSFFREQAIAVAKTGVHVCLLKHYVAENIRNYVEEFDDEGVHIVYIHVRRLLLKLHVLVSMYMLVKYFNQKLKQQVKIVHVHSFHAGIYALLLYCFFRVPYVVTEHTSYFERRLLSRKQLLIARLVFNYAQRVIAVSVGLKNSIQSYCKKEILVLPNMVGDFFFNKPDCLKLPVKPFRFLSVGLLEYNKGMDLLINAFASVLKTEKYDVRLIICGGGKELNTLKKLAEDLEVAHRIDFLGNLPKRLVKEQMDECDAFVLASRVETFGIVYIEALASGKPIVMTNTDAAENIITPGNGFLVPKEDIPALAKAMKDMVDQYSGFDAEHIRQGCYDKFSETVVISQLNNIYRTVLFSRS